MTTERNQTLMDQSISPVTEKRSRTASTASSPKKRKSTSLPVETVEYLKAWMMSPEHVAHPYPTEQEKAKIMADTGIELKQLTNWFVNNRKRFWKPRVEGKLQKQQTGSLSSSLPQVVSTNSVSALLEKDRLQSPVDRFISASSSDDESLATDSSLPGPVMMEEPLSHQEMLPVHILHHSGSSPTLQDVSVLSNIPQERILQTFRAIIRYNKEKRVSNRWDWISRAVVDKSHFSSFLRRVAVKLRLLESRSTISRFT